jgi:hypothetical protein
MYGKRVKQALCQTWPWVAYTPDGQTLIALAEAEGRSFFGAAFTYADWHAKRSFGLLPVSDAAGPKAGTLGPSHPGVVAFGMVSIHVELHPQEGPPWKRGQDSSCLLDIRCFTTEAGIQGAWLPSKAFIEPYPGSEEPFDLLKKAMTALGAYALVDVMLESEPIGTCMMVTGQDPWMTLVPFVESNDAGNSEPPILDDDYPSPLFDMRFEGEHSERNLDMAKSLVKMLSTGREGPATSETEVGDLTQALRRAVEEVRARSDIEEE